MMRDCVSMSTSAQLGGIRLSRTILMIETPLALAAKDAMHAPLPRKLRGRKLDPRQRSLARAVRCVCAECGAGRGDFTRASHAAEARRVPPDAVAPRQSFPRRARRRE